MNYRKEKTTEDGWLDRPKNIRILLTAFYIFLALLIAADFYTPVHAAFPWEEWPAFYALFGFLSFNIIVLLAKYILRKIVKRDEDYYDDQH